LNSNVKKTKVLVGGNDKIKQGHHKIEQVEEFSYLGSRIISDGIGKSDIVSRIAQAKKIFYQKSSRLTATNTSQEVKKHFFKTYIWSLLLYGWEAWTVTAAEQ
jgi:hypothetical protein